MTRIVSHVDSGDLLWSRVARCIARKPEFSAGLQRDFLLPLRMRNRLVSSQRQVREMWEHLNSLLMNIFLIVDRRACAPGKAFCLVFFIWKAVEKDEPRVRGVSAPRAPDSASMSVNEWIHWPALRHCGFLSYLSFFKHRFIPWIKLAVEFVSLGFGQIMLRQVEHVDVLVLLM